MTSPIVIAGATGDLGGRICRELVVRGANVRALLRPGTTAAKQNSLRERGIEPVEVDFANGPALAQACEGAGIVVSSLAGLREVIVDTQKRLLDAAVTAKVRRFMPSDFAIDFNRLPEGSNRNLDLRRAFSRLVDAAPIQATSVLNGAFTDMLTGLAPFVLFRQRKILCWGSPEQRMDWTTMDDTARYTAAAALDPSTPRWLRIAGDQITANDLARVMTELTGKKHTIFRPGGLGLFQLLIRITKATTPKSGDLYPAWQGMQYMHNMHSGLPKFETIDNDRYPMRWTTAWDVLERHLRC